MKRRNLLLYLALLAGAAPTLLPFVWLIRSALMQDTQMFIAPPQWIPEPFQWSKTCICARSCQLWSG